MVHSTNSGEFLQFILKIHYEHILKILGAGALPLAINIDILEGGATDTNFPYSI